MHGSMGLMLTIHVCLNMGLAWLVPGRPSIIHNQDKIRHPYIYICMSASHFQSCDMDQINWEYLFFFTWKCGIQWTINKTCVFIDYSNLYAVDQIVENFIKTCRTILFRAAQFLPLVLDEFFFVNWDPQIL